MKKLCYLIGVYHLCVGIHHIPRTIRRLADALPGIIEDIQKIHDVADREDQRIKGERKTTKTVSPKPKSMVMDRIGF